jgi:subtilisin-like proprotein convertase family protein
LANALFNNRVSASLLHPNLRGSYANNCKPGDSNNENGRVSASYLAAAFGFLNFRSATRIVVSILSLTILILSAVETSRAQQFCNAASISIPSSGDASPYPSEISVSGLTGSVSNVTVTLNSIRHTYAGDVDILLVSPAGQKFIILSDVGGSNGLDTAATITLSDAATANLPTGSNVIASGTYKPTNNDTDDTFSTPAPAAPYSSPAPAGSATFASVFGDTAPNGVWSLYVVDSAGGDSGIISGGWCLNLTTLAPTPGQLKFASSDFNEDEKNGAATITVNRTGGTLGSVTVGYATSNGTATGGASCTAGVDYVTTSGTLTFPAGIASRTFSVSICNDTVVESGETLNLRLSNPTGGATLGSPSTATLTISRVEQFCNSSAISIPSSNAANPYPSNITVSGLSGTLGSVTVTLNNIRHNWSSDVDILLVGPQGQKFIILSDVGSSSGLDAATTITLSDAATASLENSRDQIPPGTYKPTNNDVGDTFRAPAPAAPYSSPAPAGSATFDSVFGGINPNGAWSLYVENESSDGGSISGGWCLNITTVPANPVNYSLALTSILPLKT